MDRLVGFARANAPAVVVAALAMVLAAAGFPFLLGLPSAVGVALVAVVIAASVIVYRRLAGPDVAWEERLSPGKATFSAVAGLIAVGLIIQIVPYGWNRSNPPVTAEPAWDSAATRELVVRACFDCHSNEVNYPWYSQVAPVSWAVQLHVDQGRAEVNYSEWDRLQDEADESAETVIDGEMPPVYYTRFGHSDAQLTDAEVADLIGGLEATFGSSHDGDDDD